MSDLIVKDLNGNVEMLVDYKNLSIKERNCDSC